MSSVAGDGLQMPRDNAVVEQGDTDPVPRGSGAEPELDAPLLLAEFQALRAEHDMRIGKQQEISQFALGLVGAVVAFIGVLSSNGDGLADFRGVLLGVSALLTALMLMTLDHEMNIAHIQVYVQSVTSPAVMDAVGATRPADVPFWRWVAFRARRQQHPGWPDVIFTTGLASAKYLTTILPNLTVLSLYVVAASGPADPWYGWAGFGAAATAFGFALGASAYTSMLYLQMEPDE